MRLITIIRHAKASRDDPNLRDFDRPLTERGERDAARLAERFATTEPKPDLWVSSSARRARDTLVVFAAAQGVPEHALVLRGDLYNADPEHLQDVVRELDDDARHAVLCGHNPGFAELAGWLTGGAVTKLPTCAVARIELEDERWSDVRRGRGRLLALDTPKDHR